MFRPTCFALTAVVALASVAGADEATTPTQDWAAVNAHLGDRAARRADPAAWTASARRQLEAFVERWSARADEARVELATAHMVACRFDASKLDHHLAQAKQHLAAATKADPEDAHAQALLKRYMTLRGALLKRRASRERANEAKQKRAAMIGQPAPALTIDEVLDGDPLTLASLRGKVVVLDFWATWCPPCRRVIPHLAKLQAKHGAAGLQVIGLTRFYQRAYVPGAEGAKGSFLRNLEPEAERQANRDCAKALGINYPIAFSTKAQPAYHVRGIPQLVLIDRAGVVRHVQVGAGDHSKLDALLETCLAEPAPKLEGAK